MRPMKWLRGLSRLGRARGPKPFLRYRVSIDQARLLAEECTSEMASLVLNHDGRAIHKWLHYLDLYERHFSPYRDQAPKFLEIGVSKGGSLELWRNYFGAEATIFGIDIDPACVVNVDLPNEVRIGSQNDPVFLRNVLDELGPPDIVLDDGSHRAKDQLTAFRTIFPALRPGGLYVIEDLLTAYEPGYYGGGFRRKGTAIEAVKCMIDDIHAWSHDRGNTFASPDQIGAIHLYESIVFIEKTATPPSRAHFLIGE